MGFVKNSGILSFATVKLRFRDGRGACTKRRMNRGHQVAVFRVANHELNVSRTARNPTSEVLGVEDGKSSLDATKGTSKPRDRPMEGR